MIGLTAPVYAAELKRFRASGRVWLAAHEIPADVDVPPAWRALLDAPDDRLADTLWIAWHERPTELEHVDFWAAMNAWFEIFVEEADER